MNPPFSIQDHTIHLWRVLLTDLISQENHFLDLLSPDERERADRFHFPQHRVRFILARGILREILSLYIGQSPHDLIFKYGPRGKPFIQNKLQFNLSHSEDVAVYAFTQEMDVGIDIQKIETKDHEGVAKRFFSAHENAVLQALPMAQRPRGFSQLWASKEALIKAVGEGLYVPLGDFSVNLNEKKQSVSLTHDQTPQRWYLETIDMFPNYCAAFATREEVHEKVKWEWTVKGPQSWN